MFWDDCRANIILSEDNIELLMNLERDETDSRVADESRKR